MAGDKLGKAGRKAFNACSPGTMTQQMSATAVEYCCGVSDRRQAIFRKFFLVIRRNV